MENQISKEDKLYGLIILLLELVFGLLGVFIFWKKTKTKSVFIAELGIHLFNHQLTAILFIVLHTLISIINQNYIFIMIGMLIYVAYLFVIPVWAMLRISNNEIPKLPMIIPFFKKR